jgi:hypothetical protein
MSGAGWTGERRADAAAVPVALTAEEAVATAEPVAGKA